MKVIMRGAAEWALGNPVLAVNEIGIEAVRVDSDGSLVFDTDPETGQAVAKFKSGDGASIWNALPYADHMLLISQDDYLVEAEAAKKMAEDALGKATEAERIAASSQEAAKSAEEKAGKAHASSHSTNGNDKITPASIGAASADHTHIDLSQQILHVRDEKTAGANGGAFNAGAWRTRDINTVKTNTIPGASLASNRITLPPGTYIFQGGAPAYGVGYNQAIIRNIDTSEVVVAGATQRSNESTGSSTMSNLIGVATFSSSVVLEIQHYCGVTHSFGFGIPGYDLSVFADLLIRRLS